MTERSKTVPPEIAMLVREELAKLAESDENAFECAMLYGAAFAVFSAIQLACKHPLFTGQSRDSAIEFAQRIESWLGGVERPHLAKLLRDGWKDDGPSMPATLH